jgi:hypothetical protein
MARRISLYAGATAPLILAILFGCQASGSGKAAPGAPSQEPSMSASKTVHPDIIKRFCGQPPGPAPMIVRVLKDSAGHIGGYTHAMGIVDSPITYLDPLGNEVAVFHIFGSDQEKAANQPVIDKLRKAYPVEEALVCP